MFSFHLFKRQANRRGIFLLSLFCIYALVLFVPIGKEIFDGSSWWWTGHLVIFLMLVVSLVTPVISLMKPGFSYKGHPGVRHATLIVAGSTTILLSFLIICLNFLKDTRFLDCKQTILYGVVVPLHGVHCLAIYGSYFKGPTSKFGKLYQPYLPIIE